MSYMSLLPAAGNRASDVGVRKVRRLLTTYSRSAAWVTFCLIGGAVTDLVTKGRL